MTQIDYLSVQQPLPFNSQRAGLIVFGILFCLIGLLSFISALFMPFALMMQPNMSWRQIVPLEIVYVAVAGFSVFLGIDNFRARRWVRPVCIVCGGLGFVGGLFAIISAALQWRMIQQLAQNPGGTAMPAAAWIGAIIGGAFAVGFYLIFPGLIWWFYRRESVRETVYHFDPSPSWTDGLPLPVLTAAIVTLTFAFAGVFIMIRPSYPFFAVELREVGLIVAAVLFTILNLLASILLIRRREIGWWLALILPLIQLLSQIVAVHTIGVQSLYDDGTLTEAQKKIVMESAMQSPIALTLTMGALLIVWVLFLIYVKPRLHDNTVPVAGEVAPT